MFGDGTGTSECGCSGVYITTYIYINIRIKIKYLSFLSVEITYLSFLSVPVSPAGRYGLKCSIRALSNRYIPNPPFSAGKEGIQRK